MGVRLIPIALTVTGAALIVAGIAMFCVPAAVITAGVLMVLFGAFVIDAAKEAGS